MTSVKSSYPTPRTHGDQTDDVFVGRIRKDHTLKNGINLWVVADNIRKGGCTKQHPDSRGTDSKLSLKNLVQCLR